MRKLLTPSCSPSRSCFLQRTGAAIATSNRGGGSWKELLLADSGSRPVVLDQAAERGVEAGVESFLQRLGREPRRLLTVVRQVDQSRDERARVRATQRLLPVQVVEQVADRFLVPGHALPVALEAEDAAERLRRRVADADLVRHAAQEGFVDQLRRGKVGREHDLAEERQLDLAAGRREVEVVDFLFHRNDEAVEEPHGRHLLTAEVVDHEHSRVRLPLQRCLVVAVLCVEREVELLKLQLTAGGDDRSLDLYEPAGDWPPSLRRLVIDRGEYPGRLLPPGPRTA